MTGGYTGFFLPEGEKLDRGSNSKRGTVFIYIYIRILMFSVRVHVHVQL